MSKSIFITCLLGLLWMPLTIQAASVRPNLIELEGSQEDVLTTTITILNTGITDQTYYLDTMGFEPTEDGGSPIFLTKEETESGLVDWIDFSSDSVVVPAQSSGDVDIEIFIPDSVRAGGHYAAITVSTAPSDVVASNGAIIEAKTAILVLLTVQGETNYQAQLLDFVATSPVSISPFLEGNFEYRIQNQGNVHILPIGTLTFKDVFGRKLLSVDANPQAGRVLPDSTRTFRVDVVDEANGWFEAIESQMNTFAIGPVKVVLDLEYENQTLSAELNAFWLMPWALLIFIVSVLVLMFLVYRFGAKRKTNK